MTKSVRPSLNLSTSSFLYSLSPASCKIKVEVNDVSPAFLRSSNCLCNSRACSEESQTTIPPMDWSPNMISRALVKSSRIKSSIGET